MWQFFWVPIRCKKTSISFIGTLADRKIHFGDSLFLNEFVPGIGNRQIPQHYCFLAISLADCLWQFGLHY